MDTPDNEKKPAIARHVIWLVAIFALAIASAWEMHAKPGGWIGVVTDGYFLMTFTFGSAIWHVLSLLKADRSKQLAERARLKAFNDENQVRRSLEQPNNTHA